MNLKPNRPDLDSIHNTALRCKSEGLGLSECALRRLVKSGELASVWTGSRALIYFPNVLRLIEQGNNPAPIVAANCKVSAIRQVGR